MAFGGPPLGDDPLRTGALSVSDSGRADGSARSVVYVIVRPTEEGYHEVVRIIDDADEDRIQVYVSDDEEEVGGEGEGIYPISSSDEDEEDEVSDSEEEEEEDDDDIENWTSEDSGYDTLTEDEDDFPIQQLPENFGQMYPLGEVAGPFPLQAIRNLPELPVQQLEQPEESLRREFSLAGDDLSSSTKRTREESSDEQETAKRPRWNPEESPEEPAPSISGLSSSTSRAGSYMEPAPSTSGLGSFTERRIWLGHLEGLRWDEDSDSD